MIRQILTCGVEHSMAPHRSLASTASVWALTGGSANPLPLSSAAQSWSLESHQKQVSWVKRGRRGDRIDEGRWDDSRWHRGASPPCSEQDAPWSCQTANSSHSSWEIAHDWLAASICAAPTGHQPRRKHKFPSNLIWCFRVFLNAVFHIVLFKYNSFKLNRKFWQTLSIRLLKYASTEQMMIKSFFPGTLPCTPQTDWRLWAESYRGTVCVTCGKRLPHSATGHTLEHGEGCTTGSHLTNPTFPLRWRTLCPHHTQPGMDRKQC